MGQFLALKDTGLIPLWVFKNLLYCPSSVRSRSSAVILELLEIQCCARGQLLRTASDCSLDIYVYLSAEKLQFERSEERVKSLRTNTFILSQISFS